MMKETKQILALIGAFLLVGIVMAVIAIELRKRELQESDHSCWHDPSSAESPDLDLDFDFHEIAADGMMWRCGFMPAQGKILPRVLGEETRGMYTDLMCYRLQKTECPK